MVIALLTTKIGYSERVYCVEYVKILFIKFFQLQIPFNAQTLIISKNSYSSRLLAVNSTCKLVVG